VTVPTSGVALQTIDRGTGPTVILIHGLGGQGADWTPQIDHLASRFRVLAPDLRGHGQSPKPAGPYAMRDLAADVAALIRRVGGGPVHVVGLSLGGMVAFQLAVDDPALVRTLTIVNSGPEVVPRNLTERFALSSRVFVVKWFGLERMGRILAPRLFPGPDRASDRDRFLTQFLTNDRDAYLASLRAIIGWRVTPRIGRITAPTLVVASELDYTPPERKEEYVRLMPNAKLVVVPDAHHALPMEDPETFNAVLAEFLDVHGNQPGTGGVAP